MRYSYNIRPVDNGVIVMYYDNRAHREHNLAFRNLNAAIRKIKAIEKEAAENPAPEPEQVDMFGGAVPRNY